MGQGLLEKQNEGWTTYWKEGFIQLAYTVESGESQQWLAEHQRGSDLVAAYRFFYMEPFHPSGRLLTTQEVNGIFLRPNKQTTRKSK